MRAQIFEQALLDIVKLIDEHTGNPLETGTNSDRKDRANDRTMLVKIRRLAAKATER